MGPTWWSRDLARRRPDLRVVCGSELTVVAHECPMMDAPRSDRSHMGGGWSMAFMKEASGLVLILDERRSQRKQNPRRFQERKKLRIG